MNSDRECKSKRCKAFLLCVATVKGDKKRSSATLSTFAPLHNKRITSSSLSDNFVLKVGLQTTPSCLHVPLNGQDTSSKWNVPNWSTSKTLSKFPKLHLRNCFTIKNSKKRRLYLLLSNHSDNPFNASG